MIPETYHNRQAVPTLERRAEIPAGAVFRFGSRLLQVRRVTGTDPDSVVIVEELAGGPGWGAGQFAIWSASGVAAAMTGPSK